MLYFYIYSARFNGNGTGSYKKVVKGDAWFGSVKAAAALSNEGIEAVLQVKTGHSLYPKKFIDDTLKGCPGGVHIVLKETHPNGATLVCIGYRYSSRKTLFFVMTENAGRTIPGKPYEMKFVDKYGNVGEYGDVFILFLF